MKRLSYSLASGVLLLAGCATAAAPRTSGPTHYPTPLVTPIVAAASVSPSPALPPTPEPTTAWGCTAAQARAAYAALQPALAEVDDEVTLAEATARIALSGPISALQATRRRLDGLALPPCGNIAVAAFNVYINARITEYLDFQEQQPLQWVSDARAAAVTHYQPLLDALAAMNTTQ